jgi:hypothetical protein
VNGCSCQIETQSAPYGYRGGLARNGPILHWGDEANFGWVRGQPPLFVTPELLGLLQWAVALPPRGRRAVYAERLLIGQFTPVEAMKYLDPDHEHGDKRVRERWDALKIEGMHTSMLAEFGYGLYKVTALARELFELGPEHATSPERILYG